MESKNMKPLWIGQSLWFFFVPAIMIYITHYYLVPYLLQLTGYPYLIGYLLGWGGTVGLLFLASLVVYRLEGNEFTWKAFASRYRLQAFNRRDWLWAGGLLVFQMVAYFGLTFTAEWLASVPLFAPPAFFPPELTPGGAGKLVPGIFMGMSLRGIWWLPVTYFLGWGLNIFGEEFWFRGYLQPRQEMAYGKYAWLVQGVLWTLYHIVWKWNLIVILPVSLSLAYVVQRRQNTWIGIIAHGLANFSPVLVLIAGVIG